MQPDSPADMGNKAMDILSHLAHVHQKRIDEVASLQSFFRRGDKPFKAVHILAAYVLDEAEALSKQIDVFRAEPTIDEDQRTARYLEQLNEFSALLLATTRSLHRATKMQWMAKEGKIHLRYRDNDRLEKEYDYARQNLSTYYTEFKVLHESYVRTHQPIAVGGIFEELERTLPKDVWDELGLD